MLVLNVPFVNIIVPLLTENALPSVQVPPTPLNVGAPIATLLVVIVFDVVALKVVPKLDAQELTVPDENDILPEIVIDEEDSANATTPRETVKSRQANAPVQVTVYVPT